MGVKRMKRMAIDELLIKIPQKIKDCEKLGEETGVETYRMSLMVIRDELKDVQKHHTYKKDLQFKLQCLYSNLLSIERSLEEYPK